MFWTAITASKSFVFVFNPKRSAPSFASGIGRTMNRRSKNQLRPAALQFVI
jgi:hypothetical protein